MATGGNVSRTIEGGDESFYDIPCSLCDKEGRHAEAVKYCEKCLVYLCDPCLRDEHNKIHQLLDQSQFSYVNKSARGGSHCVKTQHLPDASQGIQTSKEYQGLKTRTRALISDLEKVLSDQNADSSRIVKEKQYVTQTIADFRKTVNKYFDDLEKNCLAELDHRERPIIQGIDKDKKYIETTKSKAEDILKQLESFQGDNEFDLFIQIKKGSKFLSDVGEKLQDICKADGKPSIHFETDRSIEEYIASLQTLGSFSRAPVDASQQPLLSTISRVTSTGPLVLPNSRNQPSHEVQHLTFKAKLCGKVDVKEKSDSSTCYVWSICQLPDDTFLITDWFNRKVKRLDQSLKLLDSVQMSVNPYIVCAASPGQAAVSTLQDDKIQFVSVGEKLTLTGSFSVGSYCRGMVYIDNELFVCCGTADNSSECCIEVYNNTGQLQRTIPHAPQSLSSVPLNITASDDGQHLLVTSLYSDNITMLDLIGNVVNTYSHKDLKNPQGMCIDSKGQVIVCGHASNTVVQLSPKHPNRIEVILNEADGIKKPQGVYYDKGKSRLLVSFDKSNEILTVTLK